MAATKSKGGSKQQAKREVASLRLYWEQGDMLNEIADVARCSVAAAVERYLDGPIRDALRKLYAEKAKALDSLAKSSRSASE